MKYGNWQLRDDAAYYFAQNIVVYPSSNSSDQGSQHIESNVRSIVRRITPKSYKLNDNDFVVTMASDRKSVNVSPGEGNIQGYHIHTNASLSIKIPENALTTPYTLGLCLSYDAANNVTGDVVAYDKPIGQNEIFSGVYLYFYDECQLRENYDNILVLGRAWTKNGAIVADGTSIENEGSVYDGYYIQKGFEPDPLNNNAIHAENVQVSVEGAEFTAYDAIQNEGIQNIVNITKYGTMNYEAEQDPSKYTKPPTITTDLQDYANYHIDWYTNKFGDYMTGALRFDQLSIDGKIHLDPDHAVYYRKDISDPAKSSTEELKAKYGRYHGTEGVFISPRKLGSITDRNISNSNAIDWSYGGTLMSVVPYSYGGGIDNDKSAVYSALMSSAENSTGLVLNSKDKTRSLLGHYLDTGNLIIDNIDDNSNESSLYMNKGKVFIDSYNGSVIQLYSAKSPSSYSVAFRFEETAASVVSHSCNKHRADSDEYGYKSIGQTDSEKHIEYGIEKNTVIAGSGINNTNNYIQVGSLKLNSYIPNDEEPQSLCNCIEVTNGIGEYGSDSEKFRPYHRNGPSRQIELYPEFTSRGGHVNDYLLIGSNTNEFSTTLGDSIVIYRDHWTSHKSGDYCCGVALEHDWQNFTDTSNTNFETKHHIFNSLTSFSIEPNGEERYKEAGGIYSYGNIGASTAKMKPFTGTNEETGPYQSKEEWVRFTRFRYDRDQYTVHDGTYAGNSKAQPNITYGDTYNIEFNTNVANKRANQIIWHYNNPNPDASNKDTQPLTLSYIHDEMTEYPNDVYYDYNMYEHKNPTYGVTDFLRIDGGGLSIHGDINNPTLAGDENNLPNRFGMTLIQGRVYSGVYNDYAETYEKANTDETAVEGMIVMLDAETGKYKICDEEESGLVVGVISDNYGMLIGGKSIDSTKDHLDSVLQIDNFAVGVSGKLFVNVISNDIELGDLIVASSELGLGKAIKNKQNIVPGTVIGKALSKAQPVEGTNYYRCLMQIMLA